MITLNGINEAALKQSAQIAAGRIAQQEGEVQSPPPPLRAKECTRDTLIRSLTPFVMKATGLPRDKAKEFLAKISPEARYGVLQLRGAGLIRSGKRKSR